MGEAGGGRCLDEERTVLAATDVHCKLILNVRLARNHNAKSMALIFAISETEAICRTNECWRTEQKTRKRSRTRGVTRGDGCCSRLGRRPYLIPMSKQYEQTVGILGVGAVLRLRCRVEQRYRVGIVRIRRGNFQSSEEACVNDMYV